MFVVTNLILLWRIFVILSRENYFVATDTSFVTISILHLVKKKKQTTFTESVWLFLKLFICWINNLNIKQSNSLQRMVDLSSKVSDQSRTFIFVLWPTNVTQIKMYFEGPWAGPVWGSSLNTCSICLGSVCVWVGEWGGGGIGSSLKSGMFSQGLMWYLCYGTLMEY